MSGIHHCLVLSPPLYAARIEESFKASAVWHQGLQLLDIDTLKQKVCILRSSQSDTSQPSVVLCVRITPWTCSSARCGLMNGWNSKDLLKSCGSTIAWWKRSGYRTHSSETQRSPFLTTWPRRTNCSVLCRMAPSFTLWGDLTIDVVFTSYRRRRSWLVRFFIGSSATRLTISADCPMKLVDFPMDGHACPLRFGSCKWNQCLLFTEGITTSLLACNYLGDFPEINL